MTRLWYRIERRDARGDVEDWVEVGRCTRWEHPRWNLVGLAGEQFEQTGDAHLFQRRDLYGLRPVRLERRVAAPQVHVLQFAVADTGLLLADVHTPPQRKQVGRRHG